MYSLLIPKKPLLKRVLTGKFKTLYNLVFFRRRFFLKQPSINVGWGWRCQCQGQAVTQPLVFTGRQKNHGPSNNFFTPGSLKNAGVKGGSRSSDGKNNFLADTPPQTSCKVKCGLSRKNPPVILSPAVRRPFLWHDSTH